MTKPIINPATLTEEQREAIRRESKLIGEQLRMAPHEQAVDWYRARNLELIRLFGKSMFEKGE